MDLRSSIITSVSVCLWVCAQVRVPEVRKGCQTPLELQSQRVVSHLTWVMGTKVRPFASALNVWTTSPAGPSHVKDQEGSLGREGLGRAGQ